MSRGGQADSILYGRTRNNIKVDSQGNIILKSQAGIEEYYDEDNRLFKITVAPGHDYSFTNSGVISGEPIVKIATPSGATLHIGQRYDGKNQLHREGGPAVEHNDGYVEYWHQGMLHREAGPAIIHSDGSEQWYYLGKLERNDGPAIKTSKGFEAWYNIGQLHRDSGPAVTHPGVCEEYWIHGKKYQPDAYWRLAKIRARNQNMPPTYP